MVLQNELDIYTHLLTDSDFAGFNSAGMKFQVQSLPNLDYEDMIVPLGITAAPGKEITINSEINNLPSGIKVFIEDRENKTFTDLSCRKISHLQQIQHLNGIGRFYIHTRTSSALNTDDVTINSDYVNIYNTSIINLNYYKDYKLKG